MVVRKRKSSDNLSCIERKKRKNLIKLGANKIINSINQVSKDILHLFKDEDNFSKDDITVKPFTNRLGEWTALDMAGRGIVPARLIRWWLLENVCWVLCM